MMILAEITVTWLDYLSRAGITVFLILVIYGGYKGWFVFRKHHEDSLDFERRAYADLMERHNRLRREKDAWMNAALKGTTVLEGFIEELRRTHR